MHTLVRVSLVAAVASAFAIAACGGDVVVDDESPSGNGGSGPSTTSSTGSPSVSSSSTGAPSVVSSSTGGPVSTSTGPCQTCGDAIGTPQVPAPNVCPGTSQQLYDALVFCLCASVCAGACSDNVCIGNGLSDACSQCLQSSCFEPFSACANDI